MKAITQCLPLVAAACAVVLLSETACAQLLYDDFESDAVGSNPSGWTLIEGSPTIGVVSGSSTGGTAPNERLLNFNSNGSTGHYQAQHGFTTQTNNEIAFSFSIRFNSIQNTNPNFEISGFARVGFFGANSAITTGSNAGFYYYLPGSTSSSVSILSNIIESDWYEVTARVNTLTGLWSLRVDNLNSSAVGQDVFVSGLTQWGSSTYVNYVRFSRNGSMGAFDIDDVSVANIPEPSVCALAGLGLGCLLLRKRRR